MKIASIFIISSCFLLAQETFTIVSVSPFYTFGKYSNKVTSGSSAIYGSVNYNSDLIISTGYDLISLKSSEWKYYQNSYYLTFVKKISSFYLKFAGVYIKGNYQDNFSDSYNYKDENLSFTSEIVYKLNWNYLGFAYNYFNASKGYQILKSSNITLRYDTFLDYYTYISIRPNFYFENSGKKFVSLSSKLTHWITSELVGNIYFTVGNRRYYFDNDLLTFYNQYNVQKIVGGAGLDYSIIDEINLSAGYQHTKFENFSINYFFIGIRTKFIL